MKRTSGNPIQHAAWLLACLSPESQGNGRKQTEKLVQERMAQSAHGKALMGSLVRDDIERRARTLVKGYITHGGDGTAAAYANHAYAT